MFQLSGFGLKTSGSSEIHVDGFLFYFCFLAKITKPLGFLSLFTKLRRLLGFYSQLLRATALVSETGLEQGP